MRNHPDLPANSPQWLKDADVDRPNVSVDEEGRVTWHGGVWRGGDWYRGVWHGGDWYRGVWHGGDWYRGVWYGGVWHGGDWHGGVWHGGDWYGGDWHGGDWRGGDWYRGDWHGGRSSPTRCKWLVTIYEPATVHIGCKSMTVAEWDAWFAGTEEFETKRGTMDFALIQRAYAAARAALEIPLPK